MFEGVSHLAGVERARGTGTNFSLRVQLAKLNGLTRRKPGHFPDWQGTLWLSMLMTITVLETWYSLSNQNKYRSRNPVCKYLPFNLHLKSVSLNILVTSSE